MVKTLHLSLCLSPGEGLVVVTSVHAGTGNLSGRSRPERKHCCPRSSSVRTSDLYTGVYCMESYNSSVFSQPVVVGIVVSLLTYLSLDLPSLFVQRK